jgi:DDE superfamily endonuclease
LRKGSQTRKVPDNKTKELTHLNLNTLKEFRHGIYDCFLRAKDGLFNTMDALITEDRAQSFPELSLSPSFVRKWPSLYEAFEDGRIERNRLRRVLAQYAPKPPAGHFLWIGVDSSNIARPCSLTSADRSALHVHNLPECQKPITFGWQFSTMVVLPEVPSSWTYILEQRRVPTDQTALQIAVEQIKQIRALLPTPMIFVLDRGYDATWLWCQLSGLGMGVLGRLKCNRCFSRPAPPPTGKRGARRKDGDRLQPKDASTHAQPDGTFEGTDAKGRPIQIHWWKHLHVKEARWLELTVIRVVRPHATNKERDPRLSWFVWIGDQQADLAQIALGYALRFGQEHGYRLDKQALMWEQPRLRTPEQFERWSQIVALAHNHLVLARSLVEPELRLWENKQRPCSPQQVRRGLAKLLPQLGTPARPPKPRGKSKGRSKGAKIRKAPRFPVVRKKAKVPQLVPS